MSVPSVPVAIPVSAELLIEAVKNHVVLYDKTHARYNDNDYKDELWKLIGTELGTSGTYCGAHCTHVVYLLHSRVAKRMSRIRSALRLLPILHRSRKVYF